MAKIKEIHAREILDSRGNPTVEVDVVLDSGQRSRASVPSGASTGEKEAIELRDEDAKRFAGKGVLKAIENIHTLIAPDLAGMDPTEQEKIDTRMIELDGTENKSHLGANAILGVSSAVLKAGALDSEKPLYEYIHDTYNPDGAYVLPVPMVNILNGGAHADNSSDIQEFMIMPIGAQSIRQAVQMAGETFHALKSVLKKRGLNTNVGDEGGFAPTLDSNEDAFKVILEAIAQAGYEAGKDVVLAIDAASDQFSKDGTYVLSKDNLTLDSDGLIGLYEQWVSKYPMRSIEDGLNEHDSAHWVRLSERLGKTIQIVGDDLIVTNPKILRQAIDEKWANAVLVKLNQIGTVTETVQTVQMAHEAGWRAIISHRSGETEDTTIADLVVGLGTGQIKTGSMSRTDRLCKYNQLMRIEEELGSRASLYRF
ncbi:MAG: phosphopyruvate hydratase [Candidatus Jacksonbacteria bacterium RIFCSPLOWO2_02_FULL_43_9]|nr:MAG: Enolase [Parcubacteria group bacterium GW2011_GWA2_43_13]OGY69365.1 MAG: phosphopyruvate hydratase [Candidatus Jacksonbacteria bacterium RIFCSPHIGHO2_02_FULL_43_10]OGY70578.1 MAG: phosphopyruvate hydratase [Candidatus Jacksonbacteria bacterium RIFCSPLOWO2_01_FULL_44_13]OGY74159.1 MAG: phosphopyruvate hydratase [Candidatus Jacksonbacteria bacterium RIFCSPLOWO2_02_FULL_43_9]HAZ16356.1 phosphopyruvate hydratase [Candidatus Jacksonbacteria bacterium]